MGECRKLLVTFWGPEVLEPEDLGVLSLLPLGLLYRWSQNSAVGQIGAGVETSSNLPRVALSALHIRP